MLSFQDWNDDDTAKHNYPICINPKKENRNRGKITEDNLSVGKSGDIPIKNRFKDNPNDRSDSRADKDGVTLYSNRGDKSKSEAKNNE